MAFLNISEKLTKVQEYNKNILLTAFSIFSLSSIIAILEKEYGNIIWYLVQLENILLISFTFLVIFVLFVNVENKKAKFTTFYYLLSLSLSQYIVLLSKNIKFYLLQNESIFNKIIEITFSVKDGITFILMFFSIIIILCVLIICLKISERNLENPERLELNDLKKLLSLVLISIVLSLIIDIKNAIIEDNEKKLKTNNNQVQYEKLQNVIK